MQATKFFSQGHQVEVVFSGCPGLFDFYIDGKPWGCARANRLGYRIQEVITLINRRQQERASKMGGAL